MSAETVSIRRQIEGTNISWDDPLQRVVITIPTDIHGRERQEQLQRCALVCELSISARRANVTQGMKRKRLVRQLCLRYQYLNGNPN